MEPQQPQAPLPPQPPVPSPQGTQPAPQVVTPQTTPSVPPNPPQPPQGVVSSSPSSEPQSYNSQMMQAQKRRIPKWLIVIIVLIIVIGGLFGGLYIFATQATAGAVKVSNEFVADLQANNPNAAYNLFSPTGKQTETEAKLAQLFTQLSPESQGTVKITGKMVYK